MTDGESGAVGCLFSSRLLKLSPVVEAKNKREGIQAEAISIHQIGRRNSHCVKLGSCGVFVEKMSRVKMAGAKDCLLTTTFVNRLNY